MLLQCLSRELRESLRLLLIPKDFDGLIALLQRLYNQARTLLPGPNSRAPAAPVHLAITVDRL